jgi:tetratricopeptide (TPR) repeat protein
MRLVLLVAVLGGVAGAEEPRDVEAREHFKRGTAFYDAERWQDAVVEYDMAYRLSDRPALLFNIAQAYRMDGQYAAALQAYRSFLKRKPDAANRADVERWIQSLEAFVASAQPPPPPPPVAAPPAPPPPVAAPQPNATYIRLTGEDASDDKQRRCDEVVTQNGWRLSRSARVQIVMMLSRDSNELTVLVDGRGVARRPLGREGMRELCATALNEVLRAPAASGPRFEPAPTSAKLAPPPSEKDLRGAVHNQSWALSSCRAEFAKQVGKIDIQIIVGPNGDIGAVDIPGVDPASRFGGCVQRILRQIRFAPFSGTPSSLKTTFTFPPVVIDG